MKLIITEEQLRLIIESEKEGKLLSIPIELLIRDGGFIKMANLYFKNKEKKNYTGIYIDGDLNLDDFYDLLDYQEDSVNDFLDEIVEINGNFSSGEYKFVSKFSKLKYVSGLFKLTDTEVTELPNLIQVGVLNLMDTKITTLPLLERVDYDIYLRDSEIVSIPNLVSVGRTLDVFKSKIKSLPMLEEVGDFIDLFATPIESLPRLKYVGDFLDLRNTPLSKTTTEEELREQINVVGKIYL